MNILYLSHLSGASYAGPTYSVPLQIEAQSKIDNVFWYNAVHHSLPEWKNLEYYFDLDNYPDESIQSLPYPFNKPDLIVVELFYNMAKSKLCKELIKSDIPYIIIPRGELTNQAQKRKRLKKSIVNFLLCKKYAKKALAIQYLTKQEFRDSKGNWNENHIIIPNGINTPKKIKASYINQGIRCVYIGRIEPYQKGLDLLIVACSKIKRELRNAKCRIFICGPDKEDKLSNLKEAVKKYDLIDIIIFYDGVYGNEKEKFLLESDVFLMPSRFEGHPMALIEALSFGLPCIATTGSNMRNEVEDFNAGWTADNEVDSLKYALLEMLKNFEEIPEKGYNAIKLSLQYDWNFLSKKTNDLYIELLNKKVKI